MKNVKNSKMEMNKIFEERICFYKWKQREKWQKNENIEKKDNKTS